MKKTGCETWDQLLHMLRVHKRDFMKAYHKRSNVESTFSAVKRLWRLRSLQEQAGSGERDPAQLHLPQPATGDLRDVRAGIAPRFQGGTE